MSALIDAATLDSEQIAWIKGVLRRAEVPSPEAARTLAKDVAASMSVYLDEEAEEGGLSFRATHDQLRALWQLADQPDPPIGLIRARFKDLPARIAGRIEERARMLWPLVFHEEPPPPAEPGWLASAPGNKLARILSRSIAQGMVLPGRRRGPERRSQRRYEPLILGVARGADKPSEPAKGANVAAKPRMIGNGRGRDDAALSLIAMLALDWVRATGKVPASGRSDKTPFGDLVHQVFRWLELPDATGALRRYWRELAQRVERERQRRAG